MATGSRHIRRAIALVFAVALLVPALAAVAQSSSNEYFDRAWVRIDGPVSTGQASRSWVWGPTKYGEAFMEEYTESPGGMRIVQYFDKSRMEITNPAGDPNSRWYVTNGLLVVELISGNMQVGNFDFEERNPASVNVAGDADDPTGPTYATFTGLLDESAMPAGSVITSRVDREGTITDDPTLAAQDVAVAEIDDVTGHSIAQPFRDFMYATGTIWANNTYTTGRLFEEPVFALGRPITEPYWANVKVAGTYQDVLLQCFERRCVTFTPGNSAGWEVEAGNVGRHYYSWRYDNGGPGDPDPVHVATCDDFTYQEEAQEYFDLYSGTPSIDVSALDELGDGVACGSLPSMPDQVTCDSFAYQEDAQDYFEASGGSADNDVDGLDGDGDGIACESLPSRPAPTPTPPPGGGGGGGGGGGSFDPLPPSRSN